MYFEKTTSTHFFDSIVDFTYPRLHKGKDWYVDFTVFNPATNKMQRKKYMLNRYKTAHEREDMAWKSHTNLTHPGKYFRPSKVKIMRPTSPK